RAVAADPGQPGHPPQVDEQRPRRQAQLHPRDARVHAGEQLRVLAAVAQRGERVVERLGRDVVELGRDHAGAPPFSWSVSHTRIGVSGMLMKSTPRGRSASMTAFVTAALAAIVPASPTPLTPSELTGD